MLAFRLYQHIGGSWQVGDSFFDYVFAYRDRLIFYAILMCVVGLVVRFTFEHYCKNYFAEANSEEYVVVLFTNVWWKTTVWFGLTGGV